MVYLSRDFFDTFSMGELYTAHSYAFDSMLYLILFVGIARVTLGKHYHGRGGKAVVGSVGTILAITAILSAQRSGFTLASLAPIAWGLFGLVLLLVFLGLIDFTRPSKSNIPPTPSGTDRSTADHHTHHTYQHTHDTDPSCSSFNTRVILEDDSAMAKILAAFIQYLHSHGLNQHASAFLIQIARTHRRSDRHYKQLLTALARSGWRSDPDKKLLAADVESVIKAMFRNNALFIEAMRIAEAAIHGQNLTLLIEAITRMQQLEQEAIKLAEQLGELTEQMSRKDRAAQSVEHTVFNQDGSRGRHDGS